MLANKIPAHEADFALNHIDSAGTKYIESPILPYAVKFMGRLVPSTTGYFIPQETQKTTIVLHFTAGYLKGDLAALTEKDSHMSVHYVVARSGKIYELYPTNMWSYHLGKGCVGGNSVNSMRTVAIEISNIGPLTLKGDNFLDAYGGTYCATGQLEYSTYLSKTLGQPYRGYSVYATFTNEQYTSLNELLSMVCKEHNIPRTFIPAQYRYNLFGSDMIAQSFRGICSHANFRPDKFDIGPAFNWSLIGA